MTKFVCPDCHLAEGFGDAQCAAHAYLIAIDRVAEVDRAADMAGISVDCLIRCAISQTVNALDRSDVFKRYGRG